MKICSNKQMNYGRNLSKDIKKVTMHVDNLLQHILFNDLQSLSRHLNNIL